MTIKASMIAFVHYIPWIWPMIIMMEVDDWFIGHELTSTQVTSVPLWLSVTGEISNLDDIGSSSAEILEIIMFMVELSVSWNLFALAESLAEMPYWNLWLLPIRGIIHSSKVPVMLHVNSSTSPAHAWTISEGDSITEPEIKCSQSRVESSNKISDPPCIQSSHNCVEIAGPRRG